MKKAESVAKRSRNKGPSQPKRVLPSVTRDLALLERLVTSVAIFLINQGATRNEIARVINRAIESAGTRAVDAADLETLYVEISKLLHAWYQEPDYLDRLGRPIRLRAAGAKASIQSLATIAGVDRPARDLVRSLLFQGLVRRDAKGGYVPTKSVATLRATGPEITGYLGQSILQLLSTLQSNRRAGRAGPMLERAAIVQDLPASQISEFRRFSTAQGSSFVSSANEWLEARRSTKATRQMEDVVTAGIHVFAFVTPPPARAKKGSLKR